MLNHPNGFLYEIRPSSKLDYHHREQKHEYLIFGTVRSRYILKATKVQEEYDDMVVARLAERADREPDRCYRPWRNWNEEAGGYYSNDDDANEAADMNSFANQYD